MNATPENSKTESRYPKRRDKSHGQSTNVSTNGVQLEAENATTAREGLEVGEGTDNSEGASHDHGTGLNLGRPRRSKAGNRMAELIAKAAEEEDEDIDDEEYAPKQANNSDDDDDEENENSDDENGDADDDEDDDDDETAEQESFTHLLVRNKRAGSDLQRPGTPKKQSTHTTRSSSRASTRRMKK